MPESISGFLLFKVISGPESQYPFLFFAEFALDGIFRKLEGIYTFISPAIIWAVTNSNPNIGLIGISFLQFGVKGIKNFKIGQSIPKIVVCKRFAIYKINLFKPEP